MSIIQKRVHEISATWLQFLTAIFESGPTMRHITFVVVVPTFVKNDRNETNLVVDYSFLSGSPGILAVEEPCNRGTMLHTKRLKTFEMFKKKVLNVDQMF